MIKRLMVLAMLAGTLSIVGVGHAICSGATNPYSGGTWSPQAGIGYAVGTGAPGAQWVGYKYDDGYAYIDATGGQVRIRTFSGWGDNTANKNLYNANITAGASPSACAEVWPAWTWPLGGSGGDPTGTGKIPLFPGADGCVTAAVNGKPCSFRGGGTGAYAVAAQTWAIYKANGTGSIVVLGTSKGSPPVGAWNLPVIAAPYYFFCAGSVNTAVAPASACSASSTGVAIITHN